MESKTTNEQIKQNETKLTGTEDRKVLARREAIGGLN